MKRATLVRSFRRPGIYGWLQALGIGAVRVITGDTEEFSVLPLTEPKNLWDSWHDMDGFLLPSGSKPGWSCEEVAQQFAAFVEKAWYLTSDDPPYAHGVATFQVQRTHFGRGNARVQPGLPGERHAVNVFWTEEGRIFFDAGLGSRITLSEGERATIRTVIMRGTPRG